jgi:homoserine trans-succinylase
MEWIFLRPKCYSMKGGKKKITMKAKGVYLKKYPMSHELYVKVYEDGSTLSIPQSRIQSFNHQLYTVHSTKVALKCLDNKRHWLEKNRSVAYGHIDIPI